MWVNERLSDSCFERHLPLYEFCLPSVLLLKINLHLQRRWELLPSEDTKGPEPVGGLVNNVGVSINTAPARKTLKKGGQAGSSPTDDCISAWQHKEGPTSSHRALGSRDYWTSVSLLLGSSHWEGTERKCLQLLHSQTPHPFLHPQIAQLKIWAWRTDVFQPIKSCAVLFAINLHSKQSETFEPEVLGEAELCTITKFRRF